MVDGTTLLLVVWDELRCGLRVHSYVDGIARDDIVVLYLFL